MKTINEKLQFLRLKKSLLTSIYVGAFTLSAASLFSEPTKNIKQNDETEIIAEEETLDETLEYKEENEKPILTAVKFEEVGLEKMKDETEIETEAEVETETETEFQISIENKEILEEIYKIKQLRKQQEEERRNSITYDVFKINPSEAPYPVEEIRNLYGTYIDKFAKKYGLDPALLTAIICQENPKNNTATAAAGLTQIAEINNGVTYRAFDEEAGCYVNKVINTYNCRYNPEEAIESGAIIFRYIYDLTLQNSNGKFNSSQCLILALNGYNKGFDRPINAVRMFDNYNDAYNYANDYVYYGGVRCGDIDYINHIFKHVPDGYVIQTNDYKFDENGNYIGKQTTPLIIDNVYNGQYSVETDNRKINILR